MGKYHLRITGDIGCEVWQDIPGYEGIYQASTYGRIKSLERVGYFGNGLGQHRLNSVILKQMTTKCGYLRVSLPLEKKRLVHSLVSTTFLPKWNAEYTQINHIDQNKENNRVENLEWCTAKYNMNYGKWKNLRAEINKATKSKSVNQYLLNNDFVASYPSIRDAERATGISASKISYCCNGKFKQTHGYVWKFA